VGVANLFSGIVRDARDGEVMHMQRYPARNGRVRKALASAGAMRGSITYALIPYAVLERAVLRYVYELDPGELLGGGKADRDRLDALKGREDDLLNNITRTDAEVMRLGMNESFSRFLSAWHGELKAVRSELEGLTRVLSADRGAALDDAKARIDLLRKVAGEGEDRAELRRGLKARLREVIKEVWVLCYRVSPSVRAAEVQVVLDGGKVRTVPVAWTTGGRCPLAVGLGVKVGYGDDGKGDAHLAGKRLSDYRSDAGVREWFAGLHSEAGPLWVAALADEEAYRKELRAKGEDVLRVYVDGYSLDGLMPPARVGRPRKVNVGC
jgi:hypothetical protein